jgi:hypothetical protein
VLTGAALAAVGSGGPTAGTVYRALDFVDAGMPLS